MKDIKVLQANDGSEWRRSLIHALVDITAGQAGAADFMAGDYLLGSIRFLLYSALCISFFKPELFDEELRLAVVPLVGSSLLLIFAASIFELGTRLVHSNAVASAVLATLGSILIAHIPIVVARVVDPAEEGI